MKHFFKILATFIMMIVLGLIGVFIVNSFDNASTGNKAAIDTKATDCKIKGLC